MTPRFAAIVDVGRVRASNQDEAVAVALADGWTLLLVADGVGGEPGGDVASAETVRTLTERLAPAPATPESLITAITEANRNVKRMAAADRARATMSSTITAALVLGGTAWVANAGDSRGYLLRGGALRQVTEDDSWVAARMREGVLTPEEAAIHPFRHVVLAGIGVDDEIFVEAKPVALQPGDVLLLCTDGLHGMLDDEEIAAALAAATDAEAAARALVRAANNAGGRDNIGVALYFA